MPVTVLVETAVEGSTFVVSAAFYDETDNLVDPTTLTWTLTNEDGERINDREDVAVVGPSSTENIVLSGADLTGGTQLLILNGTYDSVNGTDLPLVIVAQFNTDEVVVPYSPAA